MRLCKMKKTQKAIIISGNDVFTADSTLKKSRTLPANTYLVSGDGDEPRLTIIDNFVPVQAEGQTHAKRKELIINAFQQRTGKNTGILMSGMRGTGKSFLLRDTAETLRANYDKPVIVVNRPFHGDALKTLLDNMTESAVVVFDEFEKTYAKEETLNTLLPLFDGTSDSQHLFLLTTNESLSSKYFYNRPGRILYHFVYNKLEIDEVVALCEKMLHNKEQHMKHIIMLAKMANIFSYDMLFTIIDELNNNEQLDLNTLLGYLNIIPFENSEMTLSSEGYMGNECITIYPSFDKIGYQSLLDGNETRTYHLDLAIDVHKLLKQVLQNWEHLPEADKRGLYHLFYNSIPSEWDDEFKNAWKTNNTSALAALSDKFHREYKNDFRVETTIDDIMKLKSGETVVKPLFEDSEFFKIVISESIRKAKKLAF